MTAEFEVPRNQADMVARDDQVRMRPWLARLPATVAAVADGWGLALGRPYQPGGVTSWVAPARTEDGRELVLKVGWWHSEGDHEADGLRLWDGRGTVRLHRAARDGETVALLLERCAGGDLHVLPEQQQDEVIARLLPPLWREPPAGHPFRPLAEMCELWALEHLERPNLDLDRGLARAGLDLWRTLPATADREVLLLTDLHAGNVLAAERAPWLVIDPKPYVGDPAYDPTQHLLNCLGRLHADPHGMTDRMAGLCGVDPERLRLWLFARVVVESAWWSELAGLPEALAP